MKLPIKKRYLFPLILIAVYTLGPRPDFPEIDGKIQPLNIAISDIEGFVAEKEANIPNIKPDNQARIIWADSIRKTAYSIVYLHGFSASQKEGSPVHINFAKHFGANLYLSRLDDHGIDSDESFKELTPKSLMDSAKEAIAIGKILGEKVIVLSCSTGSTLSAYLAAMNPEDIYAQIMYSPNIALDNAGSKLLAYPWGTQILRQMSGGDYHHIWADENSYPYWTKTYRIEGIIALGVLLNTTMTDEIFEKITQPTFVGYYYKNEEECDHVVSVSAMKDYFSKIKTPTEMKEIIAFPNVGNHVIASPLKSKDVEAVELATINFAKNVLKMKAVE